MSHNARIERQWDSILSELPEYRYRGARALVILHERQMRQFLQTWKDAKAASVVLPETQDPSYASLDALLSHVLQCSRNYMTWMCKMLALSDPQIRDVPDDTSEADTFLDHLLEQWLKPLARVPQERFFNAEYVSRWGTKYCIDAMLEHAVMHPIRHRFQLLQLMEK